MSKYEEICQKVGADDYNVSLTYLQLFKNGMLTYEVRHIPIVNKWELVQHNGRIITLIGKFSNREEAENCLKEL